MLATYNKSLLRCEVLVYGAGVVVAGDLSHFTWWAVILLVASNIALLFDHTNHRSHVLSATVSCCVSITVLIFSCINCKVFSNAFNDLGANTYLLANFAVHYWPSLRLIPRAAHSRLPNTPFAVYGGAACLLSLYTVLHEPADVYECPRWLRQWYIVVGSLVGTIVVQAVLHFAVYA